MIFGTGIDLTEISRIDQMQVKHPHFADKVLTSKELLQYDQLKGQSKREFLAGRFSLKESFSKAYGTGIGEQLSFQDIEILNNEVGRPILTHTVFDGEAHVSVSHIHDLVVTQVILEKESV
ncbi:4'-phosphopantetheinyl transferase [Paucilactobacillus hokkaidonensis JCM 18461]|uniref:Holo-[acyl-carrier-protein] synthase n=2 Tax=Paucilactobacillus hokkaidonensis TaxID=1193095 RepID=A0A0A1GSK8_9LACO|nr:holo-ACP synthase [Paucilactobacillus hokkaidonensis]KRO09714.1 4-phosphopantetheinyl transferase [Paucilactobacillus hokkaidonensis]BAP84970.1 4'-phosphopantetheinyl transferase [Paucilactobacillus hokkaidonensis JCM 18461]